MPRETYVMRNGELVPKHLAGPRNPSGSGPQVISDAMPPMLHPCNGRMYDSKSAFRAETRARGCVEVGNEKQRDTRRYDGGNLKADISRAIDQLTGR